MKRILKKKRRSILLCIGETIATKERKRIWCPLRDDDCQISPLFSSSIRVHMENRKRIGLQVMNCDKRFVESLHSKIQPQMYHSSLFNLFLFVVLFLTESMGACQKSSDKYFNDIVYVVHEWKQVCHFSTSQGGFIFSSFFSSL
jgi:hypothetical protein